MYVTYQQSEETYKMYLKVPAILWYNLQELLLLIKKCTMVSFVA
jgi:hypothetical protein